MYHAEGVGDGASGRLGRGSSRGEPHLQGSVPTCCAWTGVPLVPSAEASPRPTPCPAGTFSSLPEQTTSSACQACPPGFYCKEAGLQAPSGQCPAGERGSEDLGCQQRGGGQERESRRAALWALGSCAGDPAWTKHLRGSPESSSLLARLLLRLQCWACSGLQPAPLS